MTTTRFAHFFALPVLSAGLIGAAALGLAGTAHAETGIVDNSTVISTDNSGSYSFEATPTTFASPAPNYIPWAAAVEQGHDAYNAASLSGDLDSTIAHP
ncbi:MAG: hypothetical protein KIH64_011170 [Mycobacterium sp.]|nr:hypothetical protein [Mycobacterium sp.]